MERQIIKQSLGARKLKRPKECSQNQLWLPMCETGEPWFFVLP